MQFVLLGFMAITPQPTYVVFQIDLLLLGLCVGKPSAPVSAHQFLVSLLVMLILNEFADDFPELIFVRL